MISTEFIVIKFLLRYSLIPNCLQFPGPSQFRFSFLETELGSNALVSNFCAIPRTGKDGRHLT